MHGSSSDWPGWGEGWGGRAGRHKTAALPTSLAVRLFSVAVRKFAKRAAMRRLTGIVAVPLLTALIQPAWTAGQTEEPWRWQKQAGNPILVPSPPGRFDETVSGLSVLHDGTTYKMWYSGRSPSLGRGSPPRALGR